MKIKSIIKYIFIFLLFVLFFTVICPIVPYEGDDWYFIGSMRNIVPEIGIFNPSKVLPEILEPLCGYFGAFVIKPITGDYVGSLSLAASIFVSAIITIMSYLFNRFITCRFKLRKYTALIYELLFLILFFVFFKQGNANSYYGFWSKSYNCYFNYLIPGLINACVILFMIKYDNFSLEFNNFSYLKKGLFLLVIYFSIFSSIQLNIILSSYSIVVLLFKLINVVKKQEKIFKSFLKQNRIYFIILIMWVIAVIFDLTGVRGKTVGDGSWLTLKNIKNTIINLSYLYRLIYKPLIFITIIGLGGIIFYSIKNKNKEYILKLVKIGSIILINILYLIALYMKAGAGYATRVDATWGILFYLIIFIISIIIYCNKCYDFTKMVVPIILVLFTLVAFNINYPFYQSVFDPVAAKKVDDYIINQIIEADKKGDISVHVKVPKYESSGSNWPIPFNMATWLQNTLYAHKITRNRMYIVFERDEEVKNELLNKKYDNMFFFDFEHSKYLK